MRLNGENHHCHVVCKPSYTGYHTAPTKDWLAIVDVLRPGQGGIYRCNGRALTWLECPGVSAALRRRLAMDLPKRRC